MVVALCNRARCICCCVRGFCSRNCKPMIPDRLKFWKRFHHEMKCHNHIDPSRKVYITTIASSFNLNKHSHPCPFANTYISFTHLLLLYTNKPPPKIYSQITKLLTCTGCFSLPLATASHRTKIPFSTSENLHKTSTHNVPKSLVQNLNQETRLCPKSYIVNKAWMPNAHNSSCL